VATLNTLDPPLVVWLKTCFRQNVPSLCLLHTQPPPPQTIVLGFV
jgi:hypothetical protein